MNSLRSRIVSEAIALIDEQTLKIKALQKSLRAAGGYRKSATELQARKRYELSGERCVLDGLKFRVSLLRYRSLADYEAEAKRASEFWRSLGHRDESGGN